jgi:hypothetical protein
MSLADVKRVCESRARRERDASIARTVGAMLREARTNERRNARVAEALERALPAELLEHVWIDSATPAQVAIGVESSAAAFQVDRAIREGGLAALRAALGAPALRVRTRVGTPPVA